MANPSLAATPMGYVGTFQEQYNPADVDLDTLERMRVRDPIVKFASRFLTRSVRRRFGGYTNDDDRVRDYVDKFIMPSTMKGLSGVQTAIYFGVSVTQPQYELIGGTLGLKRLYTVHPSRYWSGRGFHRGQETGDVDQVEISPQGWVPIVDPDTRVRNLVVYTSDDDFDNPWGNGAARQAYTAWYIKHRLQAFEAIGLEKHGLPTAIFQTAGVAAAADGASPGQQYVDRWKDMASEAAMAIDSQDQVDVISPAWTGSGPFDNAIRRLDAYLFNSFFIPYLLTSESQFGTRAQASIALEAYLMAETDFAEELADLVVQQVIRPAVTLQFGPNAPFGDIPIRDAQPPDRAQWANIVTSLASVGVFDPEVEEQLRWAGELFEVPMDDLVDLLRKLTPGTTPPAGAAGATVGADGQVDQTGRRFPGAGTPAEQAAAAT